MKVKIFYSFIALFFATILNIKAESNIKIHFPGAENQKVTVWTYSDLLSMERTVVCETKVDSNANFNFKMLNNNVQKIFVEIRYFRFTFYVEPEKEYQIEVDTVDFSNRDFYPRNVVGFLSPEINIIKPDKNELNKDLEQLNSYFSDFIADNHLALQRRSISSKTIDSLETQVNEFLNQHKNSYLQKYASIKIVQLRMLSNEYSDKYVVKTYFDPKQIDYNNLMYMSFFNSFWSKYIPTRLNNSIQIKLDSVINKGRSYQALSRLLAKDSLLTNDELRELVILRNIPELYASKRYDKSAIIQILYDISASKYKRNQKIAVNLRTILEQKNNNVKAPDFKLVDNQDDTLSLETLAGKYIYIQLWDDDCIECLSQMQFTKELYDKFYDVISFISISLDRSNDDMLRVLNNQNYKWHFVFLEDNSKFIYDYKVGALPRAILIDTEGNIISLDSSLPTEYFESNFLKLLNDRKGNLKPKTDYWNGMKN